MRPGLTLEVVPAPELPATTRQEILALCHRAYGQDLRAEFDTFVDPIHVLAIADGTIVSHALWITRWLAPGNRFPLRTAYVEAVATEPAQQGHGFATAVMGALLSRISDYQLAALCPSDQGQLLYGRLGWETWAGLLHIRRGTALIETPDESVMIYRLPHTPPLDLGDPLSAEWRPGELW